jgi:hypothetical protein
MNLLIVDLMKKYGLLIFAILFIFGLVVQNKITKSNLNLCKTNSVLLQSQIEAQNQAALAMKKSTDDLNKKILIANEKAKERFDKRNNTIVALGNKTIGKSCDDAISFLIDNK